MRRKFVLTVLILMATDTMTLPAQNSEKSPNHIDERCTECNKLTSGGSRYRRIAENKRESKKDLFVSRGWGAGGMPFSVLYMNPNSSKMPHLAGEYPARPMALSSPREHPRSQHQVRAVSMTKNKYKNMGGVPRSVIPQLFVSYGWGPLGKK